MRAIARWSLAVSLVPVILWGLCLSAFVSVAIAAMLVAALIARRTLLAALLSLLLLPIGLVEVPLRVTSLGAVARRGPLDAREQAAVAGVNVLLAGASAALGFSDFGWETLVMLSPVSLDGACPPERMRRYHESGSAPLRVWSSEMPLRSPRIRREVRALASRLPADASEGQTVPLAEAGPFTWSAKAYTSASEANRVPIALNTPTTLLTGAATRTGERWRLDLVVHLFVEYPERATLGVGPLSLEEGMFRDAALLIHPYCAEYRFTRYADDPFLSDPTPIRGPFERASTWLLRAAGAGYR